MRAPPPQGRLLPAGFLPLPPHEEEGEGRRARALRLCGHPGDEAGWARGSGTRLTRSGERETCTLLQPSTLPDLPWPAQGTSPLLGRIPGPPGGWRRSRWWWWGGIIPCLLRTQTPAAAAEHEHQSTKLCGARETQLPRAQPAGCCSPVPARAQHRIPPALPRAAAALVPSRDARWPRRG